jgi:hypothetical protein
VDVLRVPSVNIQGIIREHLGNICASQQRDWLALGC